MKKKSLLRIAVALLKEKCHYVGNESASVPFDIKVDEGHISVFGVGPGYTSNRNFYWTEDVFDVSKALGLSLYMTYDNEMEKIVCRIF